MTLSSIASADVMEELRMLQADANKLHEQFNKEGRQPAPEETDAWVAQGEAGYVNCLLTTLAEGKQDSVELYLGGEFADLVELANGNPGLQNWTKKLKFNYKKLSMNDVLAILVNSFELQVSSPNHLKTVLV